MKLLLKLFIAFTATFLGMLVLYVAFAWGLALIPVNQDVPVVREGVEIFITTNGVHADFTLPVVSPGQDWRKLLLLQHFPGAGKYDRYLAFGWGDKGFYLHTPEWSDLTLSTAVNALFLPSPTAMHVTYYRRAPNPGKNCRRLILSQEQYQQLIQYILASFEKDAQGELLLIADAGYGSYDNFYEARGSYSLLYTCNSWVNEGLKKIGVKTALWSPFDRGILQHLEGN